MARAQVGRGIARGYAFLIDFSLEMLDLIHRIYVVVLPLLILWVLVHRFPPMEEEHLTPTS